MQEANEALLSLPTHIQVANNLYVNYRCERKPLATKDFIEAEVYSDIVYGNTTCDLPVARMDRDVESLNYMVDFWVSQHIPNCLLNSAHTSGLLNFVVDKDFDGGKLKSFLSTSCSLLSPCIGRLFPKLREEYPNEYVDFRFVTAQRPPLINVAPNGVHATASMFLDSFISPWTNQTSRLFRLGYKL
ncbi:unnamed protein product [Anisakis simplex]|uniref:Lipid-binding serum glycoprotein C-terminal domain-containing protein n=1 Tax=Anisakis simplex TaxID=6269 RepID=A0A3P6N9Z0_ANISI|nr:unnamed protein product [Anisakis simplex]